MKNHLTIAAGGVSLFIVALAQATIECPKFVPANWTITSSGSSATGGITFTGANDFMTLSSPDNQSGLAGSWDATWTMSNVNFVSFNWAVISSPDSQNYDTFGYTINGVFTQLANNETAAGLNFTGVNLNVGDVFGFRISSADNLFGALGVNVSCFVPAPGALALLGLAGLVGRRRRR